MAQQPPDHFYRYPQPYTHSHQQLQLPPQFRSPFELLLGEHTASINYNYIRPYIQNQQLKPDYEVTNPLVMRRQRRTRTTFTSAQVAELEQNFLQGRYLTPARLAELSGKLCLSTSQVKIWFKNRRRRHKIQWDQQREKGSSYDRTPASPTIPSSSTSELTQSNPQASNLGSSGGSTPTTLTPSPTPTTQSANLIEQYNDTYNPYYYNNNVRPQSHGHQYPPPAAVNIAPPVSQFFATSSAASQHQHHPQHRTDLQQYHSHQNYEPQQRPQNGNRATIKDNDHDFNFNNPYFMRMSTAVAAVMRSAAQTTMETASAAVVKAQLPSNAMSPNSEIHEPLTPKNDESPNLCNGVDGKSSIHVPDEMYKIHSKPGTLRQILKPNNTDCHDDIYGHSLSMINGSTFNPLEDCTGAFSKYTKKATESHESNYHCTMDTIMNSYNSHRNSSSNTQFAYCFN